MPPRKQAPGAYRWLDWGPRDGTGGSQCRDADNRDVRPLDEVVQLAYLERVGTVVELLEPQLVAVRFIYPTGARVRRIRPDRLRVTRPATDDDVRAAAVAAVLAPATTPLPIRKDTP